MEIELKEIQDFLAGIPPFDRLSNELLEQLTRETSIRYIRRGMPLPPENVTQRRLYIIRKGAIALKSNKGKLLGKLSDGDVCTIFCIDVDHGKVRTFRYGNNTSISRLRFAANPDSEDGCAGDDMVIGHGNARLVNDEAGAGAGLV